MANDKILKDKILKDKILKDEILKDEELDNVAGGTRLETYGDGYELVKRGLLSEEDALNSALVRDKLHELGYTGYKDNGGLINANIYKDKSGNVMTREDFWKAFDADNGIKTIR